MEIIIIGGMCKTRLQERGLKEKFLRRLEEKVRGKLKLQYDYSINFCTDSNKKATEILITGRFGNGFMDDFPKLETRDEQGSFLSNIEKDIREQLNLKKDDIVSFSTNMR